MHYPLSELADFTFFLILFVLPSVLAPVTGAVSIPSAEDIPELQLVLYAVLTAFLAVRYHTAKPGRISAVHEDTDAAHRSQSKVRQFLSSPVTGVFTTFMYLMAVNFIVTEAAVFFSGEDALPSVTVTADTLTDKLFLIFWTALLAAFEEFTYRWLLPARLGSFVRASGLSDSAKRTATVLAEAAVICLFALSHRYMGWWAVVNALISGFLLRFRFYRTGSVYPALIAHILYNLTAFYGILKP